MATAGIAIDDWKQIIFENHLKKGGFTYSVHEGPVRYTKIIRVNYNETDINSLAELQTIINSAVKECAKYL